VHNEIHKFDVSCYAINVIWKW